MNIQLENTVIEFDKGPETKASSGSEGRNGPVLYTELKRRNVLRSAAAYIVVAWIVAQVASVLCDGFLAPGWVMRAVLIALALGLPIAVIISWYFEFTASFKWDPGTESIGAIAHQRGRKIDFVIISLLTLTVSMLLVWRTEAISEPEFACTSDQDYSYAMAEKETPKKNTIPN